MCVHALKQVKQNQQAKSSKKKILIAKSSQHPANCIQQAAFNKLHLSSCI